MYLSIRVHEPLHYVCCVSSDALHPAPAEEKREERAKQRLEDYYKRNYKVCEEERG